MIDISRSGGEEAPSGMRMPVRALGQAGFRFQFGQCIVYIDPYLSNSVEKVEGKARRRTVPIRIDPSQIDDADYVFVTHAHSDHCDPETIIPISASSQSCRFVCPGEVAQILRDLGIRDNRLIIAPEEWITMSRALKVRAVPAAHPTIERDLQGNPRCVGYIFEFNGRRLYHSGDTSVCHELLTTLSGIGTIDTAFLPVNERNYYRERDGIIGNMSVREAFKMATDIGVKILVPMHWDMFEANSVFCEEIELLYKLIRPNFTLAINPTEV